MKCRLLISVLFTSLFIVENQRLQIIITGHLHIIFSSYPSGCWWFCLCCVTDAVLRNQLRWEAAVSEERVLTRHRIREEQQEISSKESHRSVFAMSVQLSEARYLNRKRGDGY